MRFRRLACLGLVLAWLRAAATAASPFDVVPTLSTNAGRACLSMDFRIPDAHLLYAEKIEFRVEGTTNRLRFNLPRSVPVRDRFSGQTKQVYAASFTADWILPKRRPAPLRIEVALQGCNRSACFFPEIRRFEIDAAGGVRELADPMSEDCHAPEGPAMISWGRGHSAGSVPPYLPGPEVCRPPAAGEGAAAWFPDGRRPTGSEPGGQGEGTR